MIRFGKRSVDASAQRRNPGLIEHGKAEGCVPKGNMVRLSRCTYSLRRPQLALPSKRSGKS
jgi:hypothetical protein